MHQSELSRWFGAMIQRVCKNYGSTFTQTQLIRLMGCMMHQNMALSIGIDQETWNKFFSMFYLLRHECRDGIICRLLGMMQSEGSNAKPGLKTFGNILHGISTNDDIQAPNRLIDLIMNDIMSSHGMQPDIGCYQSQFRSLVKTWKIRGITVLFLNQSEFLLIDSNMDVFDAIFIANVRAHSFPNISMFLSEAVIPSISKHKELMNAETYRTLARYYRKYPDLRDWLPLNRIFLNITGKKSEVD